MKLLFIASNPQDAGGLSLESEVREIRDILHTVHPDDISAEFIEHVEHQDWARLLLRAQLDCLHISAHGETDSIKISDYKARSVALTAEALGTYVSTNPPRLVFLNGCNSADVAEELTKYVDLAIGCSTTIKNYMARHGVVIFYQYLLSGESVLSAFNVCRAHLRSASAKTFDMVLHASNGVDPSHVRLKPRMELLAKFMGTNRDGGYNISLGARGCPDSTSQVVFFTDDTYHFSDSDQPLEDQLCKISRNRPENGVIWADSPWCTIITDARFNCACSCHGRPLAASAMLSEALIRNYEMRGGRRHNETQYAMIAALQSGALQR